MQSSTRDELLFNQLSAGASLAHAAIASRQSPVGGARAARSFCEGTTSRGGGIGIVCGIGNEHGAGGAASPADGLRRNLSLQEQNFVGGYNSLLSPTQSVPRTVSADNNGNNAIGFVRPRGSPQEHQQQQQQQQQCPSALLRQQQALRSACNSRTPASFPSNPPSGVSHNMAYPQHHRLQPSSDSISGLPLQTSPQHRMMNRIGGGGGNGGCVVPRGTQTQRLEKQTPSGSTSSISPQHVTSGDRQIFSAGGGVGGGMSMPRLDHQVPAGSPGGGGGESSGVRPVPFALDRQQQSGNFPRSSAGTMLPSHEQLMHSSIGMNQAPALLQQGRQQQQEQMRRLNQQSHPIASSGGGMRVPSDDLLGNMLGTGLQQSNNLPAMNGSSCHPHHQQQAPFVTGNNMRTTRPQVKADPEQQDDQFDAEGIGPLRPLKIMGKPHRRNDFKREASDSSLLVENILDENTSGGVRGSGAAASTGGGTTGAAANFNLSAHMSTMSLTIDDMGLSDHRSGRGEQSESNKNPDSLATRLNNSIRLGTSSSRAPRVPTHGRRSGNGDGAREVNDSDHYRPINAMMDMSVATEFGDTSMLHLAESEANMSFSNVFEETE